MQSAGGLTFVGLGIIAVTVGILLRGRSNPIVVMTLVPVVGALIAGYGIQKIGDFYSEGLESVMSVVVMFIFAIIYFGILNDTGLFTPLVKGLIIATRGNVILVALGTAAIGSVVHLDGAGATTFLICIPALLPLYKAMHMSRYVLLAIIATAASVMNMVPWAGPIGRASSVIDQTPVELWQHILPIQGIALVLVFAIAGLLGWKESRRIAKLRQSPEFEGSGDVDVHAIASEFEAREKENQAAVGATMRTGRWVTVTNIVLSLVMLALLMSGWIDPGPVFLIGTTIALVLNFPKSSEQADTLKRHAPNALSMAGVILAAAMFLGVLNGSGMLEEIALSLLNILPDSVGAQIHVIIGLFGVPLDLLTSTDAYYFSVLPVVQETSAAFGVSGTGAAASLIIGNIIGTFVSPFSPALWLAIGLSGGTMGKHLKVTFPIAWAFGAVMVLIALALGLLA
ncbi:MAG TPA: citrate:proton symporter [Candidatus Corynebacterium avicola]|uniref:Citrate:proton symporter n=1 Tax=Candidatus Corynebacterium avicola TaxID=2838527 RepID=A0A9D1RMZ9_9CORY|nr:citrate:proton symporter [Candidatus Corynebacterium avicola]